MKSITTADNLEGKRVLVRVDWNVPIGNNGEITDISRIEASLETIRYIKNQKGTPILMSHFGRAGDSIDPVIKYAKEKFEILQSGVEFLENLRKDSREELNNTEFALELASKGDIYVNEAFSASHRNHASIVGVPKLLPSFAGIQFIKEYQNLSQILNPEHPFLFLLGGAKLETKLPLITKFLDIADEIFIGGALAKHVHEYPFANDPKISLPVGDIASLFLNEETVEMLKEKMMRANFILWNGPFDNYENGYKEGTIKLADILANSGKKVILGGGDTLAILKNTKLLEKFYFVSTAGGAMLDFLANGTLPGIEALN